MRLHVLLFLLAGSIFAASWMQPTVAHAQTTTKANGTLAGAVTDPSGGAISGARVAAELAGAANHSAKAAFETASDADGRFSLELPPGEYRVSVERESFGRAEEEVVIAAGQTQSWNVRLSLQPMSSNVVVSAAAEPATIENTAAPVDIVTREQIEERGAIWLAPLTQGIPGVSFSQLGPAGGSTTFFLDGGNSDYTKVLIDGVPMNQPGGLVDFSNFALDGIDKIEVVHGATSVLYGSDAMTGVMQIFTHRGSTSQPALEVEGDGGTFGTGHGSGQLSGLLGAFDYSAGASYFGSDGQGPDNYFRDTTLWGNFGWKFSDADTLRLTLRNSSSDAGQPGQTALDPPIFVPGESTGLHDFSAGLTWDFRTGPEWEHRLSGFESRDFSNDVVPPYGSFLTTFNRAGLNEQSSYLFHNGGVSIGYSFEVENGGATARHNQAGFIEAHYQLAKRLTAIAGGRVDGNGFYGVRAVPRVGAAYALRYGAGFWGATRLRASYGLGIKEPELLPPDCSPQLDPERSRTVDAGFDQELASNRIHFSATAFFNRFQDIVSFASVVTTPNCPAYFGSYFNTDLARANGINSTIEMKPARWLNIIGNYTYDDSKVLKTTNPLDDPALEQGNRLFKRPLHSASLIANAHFLRANFNFGGYYVGRRADSDFDSTIIGGACTGYCITSDPSYVRWDAATSVPVAWGLSATAQVQNLFDRQYQDAVGYPALGRNFRVGIKYVWGGKE
ncbi:MAG: TonB-dependent receptor [Candidatus Acidiferrales bacterium]